jgi:hypothetical protein
MNPRPVEAIFAISQVDGVGELLFLPEEGARVREPLRRALKALPVGGRLVVDFGGVKVASDAARSFLAVVLKEIGKDPLGRSLVLDKLGPSRYSVKVMLQDEKLTAVTRREGRKGAELLGRQDRVVVETYDYLAARGSATAADIRDHFGLNSTSVATNRLVSLADRGLAVRIGQEAVEGGGMQYRYQAVT